MNKYAYQLHTSAQKHRFWGGGLAYIYIYTVYTLVGPIVNPGWSLAKRTKFDYENHSCLNYATQFNQTKLVTWLKHSAHDSSA